MPPQQGEVSLSTLFADVHYYFGPPTARPPHHRFDKGSYVYLYHSPIQHTGRVEIANHAGTPDQDAFAGTLDTVKIEQTYKHPCLFTITVDGFRSRDGSAASSPQQDASQWVLPASDPQNNGKYMYRLHTVDIYFWTPEDASMFMDSLRRVLQPHQLQAVPNPSLLHSEHKNDVMNPVVAKLEKAAISHNSRSPSISTTQSFPGPPTAPPPASSPPTADGSANYAPMAYNPAAPAAPEPIAHREKTPPPLDAEDGTGLGRAAMNDQHGGQYGNPLQHAYAPQPTSSQPYMPGPPSRTSTFSGPPTAVQRTNTGSSIPPPPTQSPPGQSYTPAFAPPPSVPPPGQYDQNNPQQPGHQRQSTLPVAQYANYPHSPGYTPVQSPGQPGTPGHPIPSPGYTPQPYNPLASPGHPPPGGYTQYSYSNTSQQTPNAEPYAMHQQLYRPTEQEASAHGAHTSSSRQSNMGKKAEKVEKGIGSFLKKLDKKF